MRKSLYSACVLVFFLPVLLVAACGPEQQVATPPRPTSQAPAAAVTTPANEGAFPSDATTPAAGAIEVELTEFHIQMPSSIPAGPITFQVMNTGSVAHNFKIEGMRIEQEFHSNLQPGETSAMQVDLKPGAYEIYCPVGSHKELGMVLEVTAGAGPGANDEGGATPTVGSEEQSDTGSYYPPVP